MGLEERKHIGLARSGGRVGSSFMRRGRSNSVLQRGLGDQTELAGYHRVIFILKEERRQKELALHFEESQRPNANTGVSLSVRRPLRRKPGWVMAQHQVGGGSKILRMVILTMRMVKVGCDKRTYTSFSTSQVLFQHFPNIALFNS